MTEIQYRIIRHIRNLWRGLHNESNDWRQRSRYREIVKELDVALVNYEREKLDPKPLFTALSKEEVEFMRCKVYNYVV